MLQFTVGLPAQKQQQFLKHNKRVLFIASTVSLEASSKKVKSKNENKTKKVEDKNHIEKKQEEKSTETEKQQTNQKRKRS